MNQLISSYNDLNLIEKFTKGKDARKNWCKNISSYNSVNIDVFNETCGNIFLKASDIKLDYNEKKMTTLKLDTQNQSIWNNETDVIYIITKNKQIMKIGGSRTGMKKRWNSYLCGHCVPERKKKNGENYPGKMSVTNAYLYHTIENDLLVNNSQWEFYVYVIPRIVVNVNILGENVSVKPQVYHAYESIIIKKFKNIVGDIPILCYASDPTYR